MPRGTPNAEYFHSTLVNKPLDQVFADIDSWTYEVFEGEVDSYWKIDLVVVLPPLHLNGTFVKGMCFTHGADLLLNRYPAMKERFVTVASSMCSSFPWADQPDALFATYQNEVRNNWFRTNYLDRANKTLVPLADADFVHEHLFAPRPVRKKCVDVLAVSRLEFCKNLPLLCESILIHCKKYKPIRMTIVAGRRSGDWKDLTPEEQIIYGSIEKVLGDKMEACVELVPHVVQALLPHYYSNARVSVLGSLIEGANRSLKESLSCNTPVVCFTNLNVYTRGNDTIFGPEAGLQSDFDAEALADTIHEVLENPDYFQPRSWYLQNQGRQRMFNKLLDSIPYYRQNLPGYEQWLHHQNKWLNEAMQAQYQMTPLDWVYAKSPFTHSHGLEKVEGTINALLQH